MFVQEDSGMRRSMAKLAFRRSIWGYVQTSDAQLRNHPPALPPLPRNAGTAPLDPCLCGACLTGEHPAPIPCALPSACCVRLVILVPFQQGSSWAWHCMPLCSWVGAW